MAGKAKRLFNGKPMSHWEARAKELVVDVLLRGATRYEGGRSIVLPMAHKRLMELAVAESPELTQRLLAERDRCRENLALSLFGRGVKANTKEKSREEHRRRRRRSPRVSRRSVSS